MITSYVRYFVTDKTQLEKLREPEFRWTKKKKK